MKNTTTFYVQTTTNTSMNNQPPNYIRKQIFKTNGLVPLDVQAKAYCEEVSKNGNTIVKTWWDDNAHPILKKQEISIPSWLQENSVMFELFKDTKKQLDELSLYKPIKKKQNK